MYTRVKKDQFEIRDGVYIHRPTEAEFAPNPNSEGSMLIYTGNINSKLASGELFAYYQILQVMKVLWEESAGIRPESQKPSWWSDNLSRVDRRETLIVEPVVCQSWLN